MSRPTMDRAIEAIDRGDLEAAKALCEEMKHEWQFLHDLMVDGMAGLISFVQEKLGDDGVEEAWEYEPRARLEAAHVETIDADRPQGSCRRWPRPGAPTRPAARARTRVPSRSPRTTRSSPSR